MNKNGRNVAEKIKARSIKLYFEMRCSGNTRGIPNAFWDIIKPFVSDKNKTDSENIALQIGDKIVNEPKYLCDDLDANFVNIATNIVDRMC